MEQLIQWDQSLFFALNGSDSLFWDRFFTLITHTATWVPAILVFVYVILHNFRGRSVFVIIVMVALTILLADRTTSGLIKPLVMRLRPTHDPDFMYLVDTVNEYRGGRYGFCSSHAANTFSAALLIGLLVRSSYCSLVLFFWAFLSSYSRIYLGVHYPGDILCGAVCGMVIAYLVYLAGHRFAQRGREGIYYTSLRYTSTGIRCRDVDLFASSILLTVVVTMIVALCTAFAV